MLGQDRMKPRNMNAQNTVWFRKSRTNYACLVQLCGELKFCTWYSVKLKTHLSVKKQVYSERCEYKPTTCSTINRLVIFLLYQYVCACGLTLLPSTLPQSNREEKYHRDVTAPLTAKQQ